MNTNEESLIKHALKLYGVQYEDNIKLGHYITYIEVGDPNTQDLYVLRVYNGIGGINIQIYNSRNTSLKLNINIRSFINHWMRYFNFNKTINRVAIRKCSHHTFEMVILCDDNRSYKVLSNPRHWVDDWIVYNW